MKPSPVAIVATAILLSCITPIRAVNDGMWMSFTYSVGVKYLEVLDKYTDAPRPQSLQIPDFPIEMMRAAVSGDVSVTFLVTEEGAVRDIVIEPSRFEEAGAAVKSAVAKWSFQPGRLFLAKEKRKNIPCHMRCLIRFTADEEPIQALGPTPLRVTPAADAPVAPRSVAARL